MKTRSKRHLAQIMALLTGFVVMGCDGILGIDGFVAGCNEGAKQCAANNTPEICNAFGSWEQQAACVDQTCSAGVCLGECARGQNDCNGKTPRVCDEQGHWQLGVECEYACSNGTCDCETGQTRCVENNTLEKCGMNRQWQVGTECADKTCVVVDLAAVEAECQGECAPGKRCLGNTPQVCNGAGQWEGSKPCESGQVCDAGNCNCIVGDLRCSDNTQQRCNESNQWENLSDQCTHQTCDPDTVTCIGVCAPGETNCMANTLQVCASNGQWQSKVMCALACVGAACTECMPGTVDCAGDGKTIQTCGANGQWQAGMVCAGQTCVAGTCQGECAPGARCLGNTPQFCNAEGQWEGSIPCDPGQVCTDGTCNCTTGDRRCFENRPQLCNESNQWVNDGPACTGQTCDVDIAKCIGVCEPEQKQCLGANIAQHCGPKGQWMTTASCAIGCIAGECATCTIGQIRCTGNTPQTCGADGQWQDEAECVGQTCVGGSCQGQCAHGEKRCAGKWPQTCDPVGVWRPLGQACAVGESCYHGQCQSACIPGTKRCVGDGPQTCSVNGVWTSDGPACGTCIECHASSGTCEPTPEPLATCKESTGIAAGYYHTCAVLPNGRIKCWGYNGSGCLGLGDTSDRGDLPGEMGANLPFVDLGLPTNVTVTSLSAHAYYTCALTSNGLVKCWGENLSGQLGLGDKASRGDAPGEMGANLPFVDLGLPAGVVATAIHSGTNHTCVLTSDGRIKCWGYNFAGQLGVGDTNTRGDAPGEMGANLPFVDLGLPAGVTATAVVAGAAHSCALTSEGKIKCWGSNSIGQSGFGDTISRGDQPGEMGANLPYVDLGLAPGVTVSGIATRQAHTCAVTSDGKIKCWGSNGWGQLGIGSTSDRGDAAGEMGTNLPFVDLGPGVIAAAVYAGGIHTCARTSTGNVKCWGSGNEGETGLGDTTFRGTQGGQMGANLPYVDLGQSVTATALRLGSTYTCAILSGGSLKCWGGNEYGQLGLFDTLSRGDEPHEMGDNLPIVDL